MNLAEISLFLALLLLVLLAGGLWIAISMIVVGAVAIAAFTNTNAGALLATTVFGGSTDWSLTALPLFIWMGEILFRTRLADQMFSGLAPWMTRLPGRLAHTTVLACGLFAAVSGSSTATTATIGRITVAELTRRGYDDRIVLGSLAGSGTLGILIPPSIIMIVYGVAADVPITHLFIAGVLPGALLIALFSGWIMVDSLVHPERIPPPEPTIGFAAKVSASRALIPVVVLIAGVIGSIYFGIATATEAAAVGVVGALAIAAWSRTLNWRNFRASVYAAVRTNCMIFFILAGSMFLTGAMGFTGIPRTLASMVGDQGFSPGEILLVLTVLMIVMGCFIDGISVVVLTTSVLMPVIEAAKINPLWFGIYMIFVVEMGLVTPPVGFNLFVIQGLTKRDLPYIAWAALPYFFVMCAAVLLVWYFPQIVTWLPARMTTSVR
ncbi:MAG: TRAP transporter large permease subunit [Burkholderiales bacterium]